MYVFFYESRICCTCTIAKQVTNKNNDNTNLILIRNSLTACLQYSGRKLHRSILLWELLSLLFFPQSLNERLLYHTRLQAAAQGLSVTKRNLSHRVLTATDYVQKGIFFLFTPVSWKVTAAPTIQGGGFHNTANTMLCGELCVTFWGGSSSYKFSPVKLEKVAVKTKVFICAALWIYSRWIFPLCGLCRQAELRSELWRLFLLFHPCNQPWLMGALCKTIIL